MIRPKNINRDKYNVVEINYLEREKIVNSKFNQNKGKLAK